MLYYVTMVIDDMTVPMRVIIYVTIYGSTIIVDIDLLFLGIFRVFHFLRYERFSGKKRVILNTILLVGIRCS